MVAEKLAAIEQELVQAEELHLLGTVTDALHEVCMRRWCGE